MERFGAKEINLQVSKLLRYDEKMPWMDALDACTDFRHTRHITIGLIKDTNDRPLSYCRHHRDLETKSQGDLELCRLISKWSIRNRTWGDRNLLPVRGIGGLIGRSR